MTGYQIAAHSRPKFRQPFKIFNLACCISMHWLNLPAKLLWKLCRQTIIIAGVCCIRLLLVLHAMFIRLSLKLYPLINAHKFGYWQILCAVILFDFVIISIERHRTTQKPNDHSFRKAEHNPTERTFSLGYLPHIYNKCDCGYRSG